MSDFFSSSAFFAVGLTLLIWYLACTLQKKTKSVLLHPILVSVIAIILILLVLKIPNESYQKGMSALSYLITPATVCLALPLYEQAKILGKNLPAILVGVLAGTLTSLVSVFLLGKLFQIDQSLLISLLPKSVTTAIGAPVSEALGGNGAITVAAIIATGILGSVFGPFLCKLCKLSEPISQGTAIGTSAHVIGTSKANEMGALQGAVGSLSLVVAGLMTAFLLPILVNALM